MRAIHQAAVDYVNVISCNGEEPVVFDQVAKFSWNGQVFGLLDRQQGITKPRQIPTAISIRTTFTRPGANPPYSDKIGVDGLVRYKYKGTDPNNFSNSALRATMDHKLPIVWFFGIDSGTYLPIAPVYVVGDEPGNLQFSVAFEHRDSMPCTDLDLDTRSYNDRIVSQRLHQPIFRQQVMRAYSAQCAVCQLRIPKLLDAAHILPDSHPKGRPIVANGLSLCKIHHAGYDENIIGIRPDLIIEVKPDILKTRDGPMLLHGIKEFHGSSITVPRNPRERPEPSRLEERFWSFRNAV